MQAFSSGKIRGIDVSRHNGTIDWAKVKASGIQFAYLKATEGTTYTDPTFITNMKGAKSAGVLVGAYHFARPKNDPITDAKNFVNALQKVDYDLLPALDLEVTDKKPASYVINWAKQFVDYVEKSTGHKLILYTGIWFIKACGYLKGLEDMPLWVSWYRQDAPPDTAGFNKWIIWQYTNKGHVNGIYSDELDMNIAESIDNFKIGGKPMASTPQFVEDNQLPIQKGAKGELVKKIQQRLNSKVVDGLFGSATEADVKQWQLLHDENGKAVPAGKGLVADGVVGEKTYYAMFPNEKPQPKREPAYDVTVDGKNVMTSAVDANVLKAIADAIKDNKAKEIKIERIDY